MQMSLEKVDDKKVDSFKNSSKKLETILQSQKKQVFFCTSHVIKLKNKLIFKLSMN
jgi:hypothetical protein